MRVRVLLLAAALTGAGLATAANAGSCDVAGLRFTGPVCTVKCVVESGNPTPICTQ